MAPSLLQDDTPAVDSGESFKTKSSFQPLKSTGSIDSLKTIELTPCIGTEFIDANIVDDILNAPDSQRRIRDLAIKSTSQPITQ